MNKSFTKQDLIKKHETNVKSATSAFVLAGILGLIYIARFFITKNFDFYFSLTASELFLRLGDCGSMPLALSYTLIAVFIAIYFIFAVLATKNPKRLSPALGLYIADCLCFVPLFVFRGDIRPEYFIDVIVHLFVIVFLAVGIKSYGRLKKEKA
ncbi:MAG: hypothetical protein E7538_09100 [Ruminococcaceae bacterium]|nr:hypothetical protein [Oscillospiraceae bacterium]